MSNLLAIPLGHIIIARISRNHFSFFHLCLTYKANFLAHKETSVFELSASLAAATDIYCIDFYLRLNSVDPVQQVEQRKRPKK